MRTVAGAMLVTAELSALAAAGALPLGVLVTVLRGSPLPALRLPAAAYVQVCRGIPLAVVCLFAAFGLPALGWPGSYRTLFALALAGYTGAFVSDALRTGLGSVPRGHVEQARALGATAGQRALHVVAPQAWRPVVVSVGRVLVTMVKNSALAGSFGVAGDLSQTLDRLAGGAAGSAVAALLGISLAYLLLTVPLTLLLDRLEQTTAGTATDAARTPPVRRTMATVAALALVVGYLSTSTAWAPVLVPADPAFALFWGRIGAGLQATLLAAVPAIAASLLCGTALAVARTLLGERAARPGGSRAVAVAARVLAAGIGAGVTVLRGLPVVITILAVSHGLAARGDPLWCLVAGLALHNLAAVAEIVRTGLRGLPASHRDAAHLMGAGPLRTARAILLPQALRAVRPALAGRLVVVLTDTSLAFVVGYEDLLAVARQADNDLRAPVPVYLVVAVIYLTLSYGASRSMRSRYIQ